MTVDFSSILTVSIAVCVGIPGEIQTWRVEE
jgi:hypothetical protein